MLRKIIFFISISAAILTVLLLSFLHPTPQKKPNKNYSAPWITLTLHLHPLCSQSSELKALKESSAVIFHHKLTDSVQNKPRVIGKAESFAVLVPVEEYSTFANFNIIYLMLNSPEYSGSLSLEVKARSVATGRRSP
ncbi:hypothetical protein MA16_Dca025552 [Dendrobium catenatum]|uniref:Uncharacterized protein n=1 Tax=Dendrobium catenatum TaxID=906689 RepID=A0A2I0WRG7_9ASPA|nr:hypothetical protein MA16_Dca025552 [Dendrobium catenatum]